MDIAMDIAELDKLRHKYKIAVERWIAAIRAEEDLATADHTVHAVDVWENAGFAEDEARNQAKEARQAYEDALRNVNFHF
jgi:hypothetical protein